MAAASSRQNIKPLIHGGGDAKNPDAQRLGFHGGRYKTRTCDLPHVKRMRYQLRQSSFSSSKGYSTRCVQKSQELF